MKMLKNLRVVIPLAAGFMLLATGQSVWAEGCTVSNLDPDQLVDVGEFDGNMSCADWPSMEDGCSLDPDEGASEGCTLNTSGGDIDVTAEKINGVIVWSAVSATAGLGLSKVILDNAAGANGCLLNTALDTFSGEIVFNKKSGGSPQPNRGAEFCADGVVSAAPPPPIEAEELAFCSTPHTDNVENLDETGIRCPVYTDSDTPLPPGVELGDQKPVVVCNFEKDKEDWGVTDGSDVCCQCGIAENLQTACVVTEDETVDNACTKSMTVDPTQAVEFMLFRSDGDPCTWLKSSRGWVQWCW